MYYMLITYNIIKIIFQFHESIIIDERDKFGQIMLSWRKKDFEKRVREKYFGRI